MLLFLINCFFVFFLKGIYMVVLDYRGTVLIDVKAT